MNKLDSFLKKYGTEGWAICLTNDTEFTDEQRSIIEELTAGLSEYMAKKGD